MEIDVVCGMEVSPVGITLMIEGRSFCFCSEGCKAEFVRHTDEYVWLMDAPESESAETRAEEKDV